MKFFTKKSALRIGILFGALISISLVFLWMPGTSFAGAFRSAHWQQKPLPGAIQKTVERLATEIGPRNDQKYDALMESADFIRESFEQSGLKTSMQEFYIEDDERPFFNVEAEIRGRDKTDEIVVIGAHYDTSRGSPGANDNATGIAAMLALADIVKRNAHSRTIRFVAFTNEEPPHFKTKDMGSLRYAMRSKERGENIVAMLSLETLGYFSEEKGSQHYPLFLDQIYPNQGNFVAFIADPGSLNLLRKSVATFRNTAQLPSEGAALPGFVVCIDWSDHWSFWQAGYPAIMVTDTAVMRYPHYHLETDTADKIDYARLAEVTLGLVPVISALSK